uniref:Uncharacterized protein n=1 Tax=Steinernema glaseri TaxID=37863 RepID=A0A1I8AFC3_9BILA
MEVSLDESEITVAFLIVQHDVWCGISHILTQTLNLQRTWDGDVFVVPEFGEETSDEKKETAKALIMIPFPGLVDIEDSH